MPDDIGAGVFDRPEFPFAPGQLLDDDALIFLGDIDNQLLDRFQRVAGFVLMGDDFGTGNAELQSFAPHLFDQNRQMQFAATGDFDAVGSTEVFHPQRDVDAQFPLQPFFQLAQHNGGAVVAGERAGVDQEEHRDGRFFDLERRQGRRRDLRAPRRCRRCRFRPVRPARRYRRR